jgi:hypothetical protein
MEVHDLQMANAAPHVPDWGHMPAVAVQVGWCTSPLLLLLPFLYCLIHVIQVKQHLAAHTHIKCVHF